jgi:hypothetical protein
MIIPPVGTSVETRGEGDLGTIANWSDIGLSKKYRWGKIGPFVFYWHRCESATAVSPAQSQLIVDLPADVPLPYNFSSVAISEWLVACNTLRTTGSGNAPINQNQGSLYKSGASAAQIFGYTSAAEDTQFWEVSAFWLSE